MEALNFNHGDVDEVHLSSHKPTRYIQVSIFMFLSQVKLSLVEMYPVFNFSPAIYNYRKE